MTDQEAVVAFLADPSTHDGLPVERIETHSACVFLAGDRAYKLKRAVRYDFLDFSTLEQRHAACEAEVRLNARTAPWIYLHAAPITRDGRGRLSIGGTGETLDWVVVMRRFDQDGLLDRLAARRALPLALMPRLADAVGRLHASADTRPDQGGAEEMAWVVDRNAVTFEEYSDILPDATARRVTALSRDAIARHADLLNTRRATGHVRQCHGDLHLRNIVLIDGTPMPFDAIEFNDRIACTDVLYDVAFLVMDLLRTGLPAHATAFFNRYLEAHDELGGLALMPLFLSCRAAVRAKVTAMEARLSTGRDAASGRALARTYLEEAEAFLRPSTPRLIAIGGLSGSGKSTLAARLAPGLGAAPGAIVLRSDVIRKRRFGLSPETRLGSDGYTREVSREVYASLAARATIALEAGYTVLADAVFANQEKRRAIETAARAAGVPFTGVWLDAPTAVMRGRVTTRENDASDATAAVVERQVEKSPGHVTWHRIDAGHDADDTEARARAVI